MIRRACIACVARVKRLVKVLSLYKKELALLPLISFLVLGGLLENNYFLSHPTQDAWEIKKRAVKGAVSYESSVTEHLRELEIVYVKTKKTFPKIEVLAKTDFVKTENETQTSSAGSVGSTVPNDLTAALNSYRGAKGVGALAFDQGLSGLAQGRASYFAARGSMDSHAGFQDFINNQSGFTKLGFFALGENSSFGYQLSAKDLIEKIFASHAPHETNQLNPEWTHVGVGVAGNAVDIVFGGRKQ